MALGESAHCIFTSLTQTHVQRADIYDVGGERALHYSYADQQFILFKKLSHNVMV